MDKTININLGGSLFQIDEDAFSILRDYLQAINNRFRNVQGGLETVEDLELRIAEIFRSQKGIGGVVTLENVRAMMQIIGKPEDFDTVSGEYEQAYSAAIDAPRRLYRNPDDKVFGGVSSGLGAYFNIDPVIFRILFVLFTIFGGIGLILYLVLWVAVPVADNQARKREMYGSSFNAAQARHVNHGQAAGQPYQSSYRQSASTSGLNEVVNAFGKFFFILFRIFMIVMGIVLVLTGFLAIFSYVAIFFIKYPGLFAGIDVNVMYIPDLLKYVVNPSTASWIIVLTSVVIILPLIALIYWGIRMIFWLRVHDGLFHIAALIVWVMAIAVLSIFLFNEGVSFAETSTNSLRNDLHITGDTLFIVAGKKTSDMEFERTFQIPDEHYDLFLIDSADNIYLRLQLRLNMSEDKKAQIEIRKRSSGRTRTDASAKSQMLDYRYRISRDTLYLNDYFTIPAGNKWTADFVSINLFLPENIILYFDRPASKLFHGNIPVQRTKNGDVHDYVDYDTSPWELPGKFWKFSEHGLDETGTRK
jgi:phage shock protein PspC (stress-responsive transcriptional regulator)